MYLAHYILPFLLYYFFRNKIMLLGLLFGNGIDIDHILYRINGMVPWLKSICLSDGFMKCNGFFGYPFHSIYMIISLIVVSILLFYLMEKQKDLKVNKWLFWIAIGALLHLTLDFVQMVTNVGFVVG